MAKERKAYAPFSLTSEAGVAQTPVEGYIDVRQEIYPTVSTGTINENGKWVGVKSSDSEFIGFTKAEAIANGGTALFPDSNNFTHIDLDGYNSLQFAVKVSNAGNYDFRAVFGPDTVRFANLEPVEAAQRIKIVDSIGSAFENLMDIDNHSTTADVWVIFTILADRVKGQENMQIYVRNDSGGNSDIEFAFRRIV
jgi:hypothetical protein